jgi:hypothetical protein
MYFMLRNWRLSMTIKNPKKSNELVAYPKLKVMDSRSPAVSPSVVAVILIIQKSAVSSGSLFMLVFLIFFIF